MVDLDTDIPEDGSPAAATVEKRRWRVPLVWLIPVVAAAVAGWLFYVTLSERGPTVAIRFETAEGLESGKTKVKHKDVEVGVVETIRLAEDLSHVSVSARMDRDAERHLTAGTRFWVVRPRLGTGGVSGLGTLVSGAHIEMDPGEGPPSRMFVGLEDPPVVRANVPGTEYILKARRLGSISPGSPLYFRGIAVGEVMGYALSDDRDEVVIPVFIKAPHDQIVRDGSRFWNASGFDISMSADGVRINTESVQAILTGGITFDTPVGLSDKPKSAEHAVFRLYDSFESIAEARYTEKIPYLLNFDGSVRGLSEGAPVEFRGMKVGTVANITLEYDANAKSIHIPVVIQLEPARIRMVEEIEREPYTVMGSLVARGLRAQLIPGNLITGQLAIALDFFPDAPPRRLERGGAYPEIPTVPSDIEEITRSATGILNKIAALPLDDLVDDLRGTIETTRQLIASPAVRDAVRSLENVRPLLESAGTTMDAAEATLRQADRSIASVGAGSDLQQELRALLGELKSAARSLRILTDYLERHPEAIIQGKGGTGQ